MTQTHLGRWYLARTIVDATTGDVIACSGRAILTNADGRLQYDEAVTLRLGARPMRATRRYYYQLDGAAITATFADGQLFFRTTLLPDGTATATHQCGADHYAGTFRLRSDRWETRWRVTGAKSLDITTHYTRDEPPATSRC